MKRTLAAALLLVSALNAPAFADVQFVTDVNDVNGKLDIAQIRFGHEGKKFSWTINFYDKWKVKTLKPGNGGLNIYMDTVGEEDSDFNYYATVVKTSRGLDCYLYNRGGVRVADGTAKKDGRAAICKLPKKKINRERTLFEWSLNSNWKTGDDSYAHDYAPAEGFYAHVIRLND